MELQLFQVDAFTTELFAGNPAGVVLNADGLNERQMQNIARELNNSETAFIFNTPGPITISKSGFLLPLKRSLSVAMPRCRPTMFMPKVAVSQMEP